MDCTRTSFRPPFASSSLTKEALLYAGTSGEGRKRSFLPSSGVRYTVVKPNGLADGDGGAQQLVAAHDDAGWGPTDLNYEFMVRADLARLLVFAAMNPDATAGLRFDVTAKKDGATPTTNTADVFLAARLPWDPRNSATATAITSTSTTAT